MKKITEKLAICYTCCGPTYRKSVLDKINNFYFDDPDLYYFILTDNKDYFKDVKRKNVQVNELKDFYEQYPLLETYEYFLESSDEQDYAKKFLEQNYKFPFSTMRFHLLQVKDYKLTNIAMLGSDCHINFDRLNDSHLQEKNIIHNMVTQWFVDSTDEKMKVVVDAIQETYNLKTTDSINVFDEAARLYVLQDIEKVQELFDVWNNIISKLYTQNKMKCFRGWYAINDEYLLGAIYNVIGITRPAKLDTSILIVNHNPAVERFWLYE
jgi:hypothetical protein